MQANLNSLPQFSYASRSKEVNDNVKQVEMEFLPQSAYSGSLAGPGQQITFNIMNTEGYWNPEKTFLHIEVSGVDMPAHTIYQLDNSAQSLIESYIVRKNGYELVRSREYDAMAAFIYDTNLGGDARESRCGEGLGRNRSTTNAATTRSAAGGLNFGTAIYSSETNGWGSGFTTGITGNTDYTASMPGFKPWSAWQTFDSQGTTLKIVPFMEQSYLDIFNGDDSQGYDMAATLNEYHELTSNYGGFYLKTNNYGFPRTNTEACAGTGEFFMSNYIPKSLIVSGTPAYVKSNIANFQIPLLCPVFGALSTHGKLLPMALFNGIQMEFILNKYAFFVGGSTADGAGFYKGEVGSTSLVTGRDDWLTDYTMKDRSKWTITKFIIRTEFVYPTPSDNIEILRRLDETGLTIDYKEWVQGPITKYANGNSISETVTINFGAKSCNTFLFYFQPDEYQLLTTSRKHKRISANMTSMQLRFGGGEYIPSQPIVGHSGNLRPYKGKDSYINFYITTLQALGRWNSMSSIGILNPTNYTMNHNGYDPMKTGNVSAKVQNGYRADMSFYWENICPRALYAFDLEKFDVISNLKSGMDTRRKKPFDLLLKFDNSPVEIENGGVTTGNSTAVHPNITIDPTYPNPLSLHIWLNCDSKIVWSRSRGLEYVGIE